MALATKCPHCNTIFRVAHDQLKLRGGIVRCGACHEVFDGNAALVEPALALHKQPVLPPVIQPAPSLSHHTEFDAAMAALDTHAAEALYAQSEEPIHTLDLATAEQSTDQPLAEPRADAVDSAPYVAPWDEPAPPAHEEAAATPVASAADELDLDLDVEDGAAALIIETDAAQDDAPADVAMESEPAQPEGDVPDFDLDGRREPTFGDPPSEHLAASALDEHQHDVLEDTRADDAIAAAVLQAAQPVHVLSEELDDEPADNAADNAADNEDDDTVPVRLTSAARAQADDHAAHIAEPEELEELEEPGFVKRDRRRQRVGKAARIVMGLGSIALLGGVLAQGVSTFRIQLAAEVPQLKPTLVSLCATLGCKIELPAQIDNVSIEQGELQTLAENTFSFTTLLRNQGASAEEWPCIELILNDNADQAVLRRVFTPRDYLPTAGDVAKGFAPHSEQSVKLYFELAQLKASGYHIAVFYP